ncbi:hypothetical protein [Streptomyces sp. NPDC058694]|uniref:hypothetical protein n=1 Tax=Streptomyces sp. NPDC058694 TaxID=3346603 RepID=UPI003658D0E8
MPTARLLTLTCNATEDWTGDDEVLVKVFGTRYGEAYRPMNNHQNVNASQAGTGQKSAEFNADEAGYTLVYEVVA